MIRDNKEKNKNNVGTIFGIAELVKELDQKIKKKRKWKKMIG